MGHWGTGALGYPEACNLRKEIKYKLNDGLEALLSLDDEKPHLV